MGLDDLHHESRPTNILNDILSWSHGSHTFKFGGEARTLQNNLRNNNNGSGAFGFADLTTGLLGINSGNSIASFLLGNVDNARRELQQRGYSVRPRQTLRAVWRRYLESNQQAQYHLRIAMGRKYAVR